MGLQKNTVYKNTISGHILSLCCVAEGHYHLAAFIQWTLFKLSPYKAGPHDQFIQRLEHESLQID